MTASYEVEGFSDKGGLGQGRALWLFSGDSLSR